MDYASLPSPCFVIDEERLRGNLQKLNLMARENGIEMLVALKAFASWRLFPLLAEYLDGAAVSSLHEARLAYEEMGRTVDIYAPAYYPTHFEELLGYLRRMTFNSLDEWDRYAARAQCRGISCGLRIQTGCGHAPVLLYNPAARGSRFGVSAETLRRLPRGLEGLHLHALSEANSYAFEEVLQSAEEQFGHFFPKIQWLNLGGGHLFTDECYDLEHFALCVAKLRHRYPNLQLIFEPGSAIAWQVGVLKSTVLDIVEQHQVRTAVLDVSFTCHLPDCLEMPYRPAVRGAALDDSLPHRYRLGGISCLSGDFLEGYSFSVPLSVGDLLFFDDAIHYTIVKTTQFNGISLPGIAVWRADTGASLIYQPSYQQYKNHL